MRMRSLSASCHMATPLLLQVYPTRSYQGANACCCEAAFEQQIAVGAVGRRRGLLQHRWVDDERRTVSVAGENMTIALRKRGVRKPTNEPTVVRRAACVKVSAPRSLATVQRRPGYGRHVSRGPATPIATETVLR